MGLLSAILACIPSIFPFQLIAGGTMTDGADMQAM